MLNLESWVPQCVRAHVHVSKLFTINWLKLILKEIKIPKEIYAIVIAEY